MSATTRENLLCTMALYAGEMIASDAIRYLTTVKDEDELADFCVECVDNFINRDNDVGQKNGMDIPFDEYAEECLVKRFGNNCDNGVDAALDMILDDGESSHPTHRVIAVAGSVEKDLGIEGTYEECERWCDYYDWVYRPDGDGGFEWDLEVEEI